MDADGTNRKLLFSEVGSEGNDWSPDGSSFVQSDGQYLWIIDPRSGERTRLQSAQGNDPSWSPDGEDIAYVTFSEDIYAIDRGGGEPRPLVASDRPENAPVWATDGTALSFIREWAGGGLFVWRVSQEVPPADASEQRLVGGIDVYPEWSPDSSQLLWEREGDIWVINDDGSGISVLADHRFRTNHSARWSPDGTRIAYCSKALMLMDPDGRHKKRLTGWRGCSGISWRSDGERMAFARKGDIWSIKANGTELRRLTRTEDSEYSPQWSPDGSLILYTRSIY